MTNKTDHTKLLAAAVNRLQRMKLTECFDPINLDSRATGKQQEVLDDLGKIAHRYVVAGNQSGKSQLGAREVAWLFENSHPHWKRPKEWKDEPLLIIVVGRTTKQIEEVLWRKIKAFVDPAKIKPTITGNTLQKVTHTENNNTILFASHHADNEAREKLQAFVAHYVWVDEMPKSVSLIEELHRRVQARNGYFLATFTPKVRNDDIKKLVDNSQPPLAKKYKLAMLDNPLYEDREQELLEQLVTYSESYRNTVLYGDWSAGEDTVYEFDSDKCVRTPENYSPAWRHVESVDPAIKSKLGYTLWAEDPATGHWYCVKSEYVKGILIPSEICAKVEEFSKGHNLIRRIYDPHEAWYQGTAMQLGMKPPYMGVYNKNSRKGELIKHLQAEIGKNLFIAPWCTDLVDEFVSCRWADTGSNKIVNASTYHLLDTAQYFADNVPKYDATHKPMEWQHWLYEQNEKRKQKKTPTTGKATIRRRRSWR